MLRIDNFTNRVQKLYVTDPPMDPSWTCQARNSKTHRERHSYLHEALEVSEGHVPDMTSCPIARFCQKRVSSAPYE